MKALLDTNIIIHREASRVINQDVGILYRWLERAKYTKCVHSLTVSEIEKYKNQQTVDTFQIKLDSYERIDIPSPLQPELKSVSEKSFLITFLSSFFLLIFENPLKVSKPIILSS